MSVSRAAFGALGLLAVALGVNLYASASQFVSAYTAYDRLELELTQFDYRGPESPVVIGLSVRNPTSQALDVVALELGLDAGVHRVGGGDARPVEHFAPGHQATYVISANIDDEGYVSRLGTQDIDWRIAGRVQVRLREGLDPIWIPFTTRYVAESSGP